MLAACYASFVLIGSIICRKLVMKIMAACSVGFTPKLTVTRAEADMGVLNENSITGSVASMDINRDEHGNKQAVEAVAMVASECGCFCLNN